MPGDDDLRDHFAKLRSEDQAHAGEFDSFLRRTRPRPIGALPPAWIAVGTGLAVMMVAVVIVISVTRSEHRAAQGRQLSITEWKSSTDFLLQTPGQEILRSVPRIGEWPSYSEGPAGSRKSPTGGKRIRKNLTKLFTEERLS